MSDQQYPKSNGEQTGSAQEFVFAEEIHYQMVMAAKAKAISGQMAVNREL